MPKPHPKACKPKPTNMLGHNNSIPIAHVSSHGDNANLFAAMYDLLEDAIVVSQTVSVRSQSQRGHRVEEAGREATQATVAQTGISLLLLQLLDVQAELKGIMMSDDKTTQVSVFL